MIHPTQKYRLLPIVILASLLAAGLAHGASVALGYGGAGVYPQDATENSERYFRVVLTIANTEILTSLTFQGSHTGQSVLFPKPNGDWNDATDGVTRYLQSGGSTSIWVYTIGPYAGYDIYGAAHAPSEVIGQIGGGDGRYNYPFTFYATTVPSGGGTATTVSTSGSYRTQYDNCCILDWWSGSANGVDPLAVNAPVAGADHGSSSNTFTFRVQYRITPDAGLNLLPRFGTDSYPPGPVGNYANCDAGLANAYVSGDWQQDWWTYAGGAAQSPTGSYSRQYPRMDDFADTTGYWVGYQFPEVVLIIDGDRTRPHLMGRETPSDSDAKDEAGIRYFYRLLPTDYANFMDNLFLYPYDPPGPDPLDAYTAGIRTRNVSNNHVAMQAGNHTYEFIASADFSPPDGNRVWLQVGRPGNAEENQYMRPTIGGGGVMEVTQVQTRFRDSDGSAGGYGYPYNSQSGLYPRINPMLTAHPYFPRGCITPWYQGSSLTMTPPGSTASPFTPEAATDGAGNIIAGPNPPVRVTNDDTILPNFVNVRPDTDPVAPFRGGKWTSASTYTLRINYWQSLNQAPEYMRVLIRRNDVSGTPGSWVGYTMEKATPGDSTYTDGCIYQYLITPDQLPDGGGPGDYNYYFVTSDGTHSATYPSRAPTDPGYLNTQDGTNIGVPLANDGSNSYYAFRVNRPPDLSAQSVSPTSGSTGVDYTFAVTYADQDGELLNANSLGDRPFETSIFLDLFGSPLGQASVVSVQNATTLTYRTISGSGYAVNELAGMAVEIQTGSAAGKRYRIVSNTATQMVLDAAPPTADPAYNPAALLADGVGGSVRFRIAQWFHGTMTAASASNVNYKGGVVYNFNSATHAALGAGIHRYYFVFKDDWGSWLYPNDSNVRVEGQRVRYPFTGEFEGPEVTTSTPPILKDYRFTPRALSGPDGTTATAFVFSVTYVSEQDLAPSIIRVGIDGTATTPDTVLNLVPADPNDKVYSDGAIYVTPGVKLTEGRHIFRAQASDGTGRFPNTPAGQPFLFSGPPDNPSDPNSTLADNATGPLVAANTPPTLTFPTTDNNTTDPNNPPGLDPNTGRKTTPFTYSVTYTDTDRFAGVAGNPWTYVHVYIDGSAHDMVQVDPTDTDYTDGVAMRFQITGLEQAKPHTYYFDASDGLDRARLPVQGASPTRYSGPVVDEPPGAPLSLLAQDTPNDNGLSIDLTFNASPDDGGGANDVTQYRLYRSTSATGFTGTPVLTITATGVQTYAVQDHPTANGVNYYYVVRAFDVANESIDSNVAGPVSSIDNISPQPPSSVAVSDPGLGGTLTVTWNPSPDDGGGQADVKEYHIYRATTANGFSGTYVGIAAGGTTSYNDTTVSDGVDYFYMVRAYDGSNESVDSNPDGPEHSSDQQAPVIDTLVPASRALDVPVDTAIGFTVSDSGTGVDQASVTIDVVVDGTPVVLSSPAITGTRARYVYRYQPVSPFANDAVVNVTVNASDLGGKAATPKSWKFTIAGETTFAISGRVVDGGDVPKAGVVVSAGPLSATTNANGDYSITGLTSGTYAVTPALRGFTFSPASRSITIAAANVNSIDFSWASGYDIGGRVLDANGHVIAVPGTDPPVILPVTITNGTTTVVTGDTGYFRMQDLPAGLYNLAPALPGYVFEPATRQVQIGPGLSGLNQSFVGRIETYSVAGAITDVNGKRLGTVAVEASRDNETTVQGISNDSGQYTIAGLVPGTWTITPRKAGYVFKPASQALNVAADVSGVNYVGVPLFTLSLGAGQPSFVSLPIRPEDPNPLVVFGSPSDLPFYRYDPQTATYPASNGGWAGLQVLPGRGFWLRPEHAMTLSVPGTPVPLNQSVGLQLATGWNQMGNPYDAVLPWANVGVTDGGPVRNFAYIWDRTNGYLLITDTPGVGAGTSIPKYSAMWMRALSTQSVTISPVSATATARHEVWTPAAGEFVVPIVATAGAAVDRCASVGVLGYAKTNPAAYQIDNPPAGSGYVDVYFPAAGGQLLTCDIRGEAAAKLTYDFAVKTDLTDTTVKLSLPDLSQVPRDKSIVLVDVASGKRLHARTLSTYSYNSGKGGVREFRLEIGTAAGGGLAVTMTPASAKGGGVAIVYTLSKPASVDVSVLNLAGRVVRLVSTGTPGTTGVNSAAWDLRNQSGSRVPAGRYWVRVLAAGDDGQQVNAVAPVTVQ